MISSSAPSSGQLETRSLGGFVLRELVGAGGFGDVYLAEQSALQREAVVKVLRPDEMTDARVQRFLREAQLASRLDHPYAAHIYAFGAEPDGVLWIAMEHVRGSSLRGVLEAQGPMPIERFVPFFERICEVVHTAHEQEIIHRDLKPDNIMVISRAGRLLPKLLDFGIARAAGNDAPLALGEGDTLTRPADVTTQRGSMLGSPPYMAPELWRDAHAAVAASDQYALGALAYEALTGKLAFSGRSMLDVARAHARGKLPPLGEGFPPELDAVLKRSLARAPGDRYGNVLELAQAFRDASGIGAVTVEIPQIDEELRVQFLTGAPQPIADAVGAYDAARNAHQAREALRGLVRVSAWYVGLLALASRTRVGSGGTNDSEHAQMLLRDLRRQGLTPGGWIALARQLTQPFIAMPDTFPLPELVLLLHPSGGTNAFAAALEGSLSESLPDSSEEAASQSIARELPVAVALLRSLEFLLDYQLVVPRAGRAESWMGTRSGPKRVVVLRRSLPDDRLVIIDESGGPLLALWPLFQLHAPMPGHVEQLFFLAGPGRQGARLVSSPHNFEHRDDTLWDWFREQLFKDDDAAGGSPSGDSPYRGLSSYTTGDAQWFVGRERESEALINRLKLEAFVAVVGPSGVGKSSFIQAGVAPAFASWRVVTLRPGRAPVDSLRRQLAHAEIDIDDPSLDVIAARLARWATDHGGLLIVVDQFEELFTLGSSPDDRAQFVRLLLAASRSVDDPVRVVVTLRDDFLIRAEQLPGLDHTLARGLQLLGPLGAPALERILVEPARRAGFEFEDPALPVRMVEEVIGTPAAVALLSFTATRLWELRDRHFRQLPRRSYDALGGVGGALARHADATFEAMPAGERALARKAFRHLVTFEGTRAVLGREELEQLLGAGSDGARVIERLVDARLVVSAENDQGEIAVEIVHEALLGAWPRLVEWRREDVEGSRFHEQLRAAAKQWEDRGRPRGLLWRGDALAEYQLWRKRHTDGMTPGEAAFGSASTADAARGRRIRRGLLAIAMVTTVIFVVVLWRANSAEQRSRRASENLLRDSTFDQGRLLMLQGDKLGALPHLATAYRMGDRGDAARLLIEEASHSMRARLRSLDGHTGRLWDVAYSPDGTLIATASADRTARIWDARTGVTTATINHDNEVLRVAFSPDGKLLASAGFDGNARLWNIAGSRVQAVLELGDRVNHLRFSPDGTRLVTTGSEGKIKVWSVGDGKLLADLHGHEGGDSDAAFCGDGTCFVTWDYNGKIQVWDAHTLVVIRHHDHEAGLYSGSVDRTGSVVVIGTESGELDFYHPDGTVIVKKGAHEQLIYEVRFSPDGTLVATTSTDNTARLWDPQTGNRRAVLAGHRANITVARFSPRGGRLVTASADGTARLWSVPDGTLLGELDGHTNIVFSAAFDPTGEHVVTASWDHRAIIWDVEVARQFRSIEPATLDLDQQWPKTAFRFDGNRLAEIAADGGLAIVDTESGTTVCHGKVDHPIDRLAWSGDGSLVATIGSDHEAITIWSEGCEPRRVIASPATSLAFGPGNRLVTGNDQVLRMWSAATGHLDAELGALPGNVQQVGFHPDGTRVFAITANRSTVVLANLELANKVVLSAGGLQLSGIAFDRGRHRVLASGFDQFVWIWSEETGALVTKLEGTGPLWGVATSSDGSLVVGLGGMSPVVWNADSGIRIATLDGHNNLVSAGGFIADRMFITTSQDRTALVWDLERFHPLIQFRGASTTMISDDLRWVLLADVGGARLWSPKTPLPDPAELELHLK